MFVVLDRKRFEPALPDVSAVSLVLQIASHMDCHHPLHPAREVAIAGPSQHQLALGENDLLAADLDVSGIV